jgi:hypothetical protein
MESIVRDVKSIESAERHLYEAVLHRALHEDQRVLVMVLNPGAEPDESIRRKAVAEFCEICREGTEHRERQSISVEEADRAVEEAIRAVRSRRTE